MKKFDANQLSHFTGTERYYRISRRHLLTDGTKYLAEGAECFWMMDAVGSHLSEIGTADWFVLIRVTVQGSRATMVYEWLRACPSRDPVYGLPLVRANALRLLGRGALGHHATQ
jgi:hypothetical protein